jgi:hypothetical protein
MSAVTLIGQVRHTWRVHSYRDRRDQLRNQRPRRLASARVRPGTAPSVGPDKLKDWPHRLEGLERVRAQHDVDLREPNSRNERSASAISSGGPEMTDARQPDGYSGFTEIPAPRPMVAGRGRPSRRSRRASRGAAPARPRVRAPPRTRSRCHRRQRAEGPASRALHAEVSSSIRCAFLSGIHARIG